MGLLVTDVPIEGLEGNEIALDGQALGMSDSLSGVNRVSLLYRLDTADNVLTSLEKAWPTPARPKRKKASTKK